MKSPLLRLVAGNLADAHALGMIDCEKKAIESHVGNLDANWDASTDQQMQFSNGMTETKNAFDRQFRPIQAFKGRVIPFCSVMRVEPFIKHWLKNNLKPELGDRDAGIAKEQIIKLAKAISPATSPDLNQLRDAFVRLNQWIRNSGVTGKRGVTIKIGTLLEPATRPFWVGGKVQKPDINAQYWRDRLGLIHISAGNRCCSDKLVRLKFVATMVNEELPRTTHLEHRKMSVNKKSLWLFRPSVLHGGNQRFVQGVSADKSGRSARRGSTRDLSSNSYPEGERELLLLTGEVADARLIGVDLFEGFADYNSGRDDNDHEFVDAISNQRAWT